MTRHLIGGLCVLAFVLAAGCASAERPAAPAAPATATTPAPIATATSPAAPAPPPLTVTTSLTRRHPLAGTKIGIAVFAVPGARITVVAHFSAGDSTRSAHAGAAGVHTFWFHLGSATPGYRVKVSVRVSAHGQKLASRAWFIPRQRPPPPAPAPAPAPSTVSSPSAAPPAGCSPKTDSGNCYEPGEFCRSTDHGMHGIAGNGEPIVCADNNGWRWEPA
jgi:hypothetical protein